MDIVKWCLVMLIFFLVFNLGMSTDTITPDNPIKNGDLLVSSGQSFALGFFSPGNPNQSYIGIWYNKVTEKTVVWVANRDNPVNGTSGVLAINNQGNLVLYGNNQTLPVWSANVSATSVNSSKAQLLDTGNLVLVEQVSSNVLWQSFDYPTDTMLLHMKLGLDRRTGLNRVLSSWKTQHDPGTGNFSCRIDPTGFPQFFLYKGSVRLWRTGPWTGVRWSGVPQMSRASHFLTTSFVNNKDEVSVANGVTNASIIARLVIDDSGTLARSTWIDHDRRWFQFFSAPKEECDNYGQCGPNGICDPYDPANFSCKCMPGFTPKSPPDWYLRDGSGGCVRKSGVSTCHSKEGFIKLTRVKVPDTTVARADMNMSLKSCELECFRNCSCTAYTSADERGFGCLMWYGDLNDTRTFSGVGQDIHIRVDAAELAMYEKAKGPLANQGIQAILIISIALTLSLIVFLGYWIVKKRRKPKERSSIFRTYFKASPAGKELDESGNSNLQFFDLNVIAAATDNFSDANKLGKGGFGSVYKGMLYCGKEIAVKRLSKYSGQGIEEFTNEVSLIIKLQHRNLVRILGCCIEGGEKMLIYEYMPNKSLNFFIFDEIKKSLLDWPTRLNIIGGIARGILYLHQDSRLRIIHRDLKASNVLLDASMNPKISDFGMARIFGVDQTEANTNRVVGTYGYMAPEYAMQGLFSTKSDVYSFGVLLLEIITGRKNNCYYEEITSSNLVGYVWELWREGRAMEIVDLTLGDSYIENEALRCIQIGLLCVQDSAIDRPTMSVVVFMLSNDTTLPSPKQPAFILKKYYESGAPSTSQGINSINDVTITMIEAR